MKIKSQHVVAAAMALGALGTVGYGYFELGAATSTPQAGEFCLGPLDIQTQDDGPAVGIGCGRTPILDRLTGQSNYNPGYYGDPSYLPPWAG